MSDKSGDTVERENCRQKDGKARRAVSDKEKLKASVLKKAAGYSVTESVDEFGVQDGELVLLKRKVTKKEIPPDTAALKLLLDSEEDRKSPSLEELENERARLLKLYRGEGYGTDTDKM